MLPHCKRISAHRNYGKIVGWQSSNLVKVNCKADWVTRIQVSDFKGSCTIHGLSPRTCRSVVSNLAVSGKTLACPRPVPDQPRVKEYQKNIMGKIFQ